jgi:hypothetical protein
MPLLSSLMPALGAVEIHHAGGVGLDAHFVLDGAQRMPLRRRCRPPWEEFRHQNSDALCRPARPQKPRRMGMRGEVVLARRESLQR